MDNTNVPAPPLFKVMLLPLTMPDNVKTSFVALLTLIVLVPFNAIAPLVTTLKPKLDAVKHPFETDEATTLVTPAPLPKNADDVVIPVIFIFANAKLSLEFIG